MKKVDDVVASLGWRESTSGDHASEIETFLRRPKHLALVCSL